ncbi:hypothetical protein AE618_21790 [Bosea vaviloviae]|jgi:hypothetical protein|uniref:Uncharacterized protein n=1 Tax=Bosea vaviloviae TaxID=1526658 RepID=A0A0N1N2P9_9HYPH|nr:hypothetical protein AE618_21790 [Bosea vaviloviae]
MSQNTLNVCARLSASSGTAIARWLLALLAASTAAAAILRLQTFLYALWEAHRRDVGTAYAMLVDTSRWAEAASSLVPLSLGILVLSLPFAIIGSGFPEARGRDPRIGRYAVLGGICPLVWISIAAAILQSSEPEIFPGIAAWKIAARPELGFFVIAGVSGGYYFGRLRRAFR